MSILAHFCAEKVLGVQFPGRFLRLRPLIKSSNAFALFETPCHLKQRKKALWSCWILTGAGSLSVVLRPLQAWQSLAEGVGESRYWIAVSSGGPSTAAEANGLLLFGGNTILFWVRFWQNAALSNSTQNESQILIQRACIELDQLFGSCMTGSFWVWSIFLWYWHNKIQSVSYNTCNFQDCWSNHWVGQAEGWQPKATAVRHLTFRHDLIISDDWWCGLMCLISSSVTYQISPADCFTNDCSR